MINNNYNNKLFRCTMTNNQINILFDIQNKSLAEIQILQIDFDNIKAFFTLLRESIIYLNGKEIKLLNQEIMKEDWDNTFKNKKHSWKIIQEKFDTYVIQTILDDALENIGIGFGIDSNLKC